MTILETRNAPAPLLRSKSAAGQAALDYMLNFVAAVLYFAMASWTFATVETELRFLGHNFRDVTLEAWIIGVLALWFVFTIQDSVRRSDSSLLSWMMVVLVIAPTIVGSLFLEDLTDRQRFVGLTIALIGAGAISFSLGIPLQTLPQLGNLSLSGARLLLMALSLAFITYVSLITPPRLSGVAWSEIYTFRTSFRETANNGVLYAYAFNWQTNVVGPLLLGLALYRKDKPLFLFALFAQLALFTISGEKSILFSPLAALILGRVGGYGTQVRARHVTVLAAGAVIGSRVIAEIAGRIDAFSTIALRLLHVQGLNTLYWVDFFGNNPRTRWANGVLGVFNDYPYNAPPGFVVGQSRGRVGTNVNANFLGDGYGALGIFGVLISVAVIAGYLYALRIASARVGAPVVLIGSSGVLFSAANSGSINMLLGGGGVLALGLLMILPSEVRR